MAFSKLIANQLGHPTGIFGSLAAFVWNRRNAVLNDTVLDLLSLQPKDRVLDIGFGGGYLLNRMAGIVTEGLLTGVDRSPAMVANAEMRYQEEIRSGRLDLKCAVAEALPYPDEYFTKVCSVNSIFYWQDVEQGLREILRVLMKDGKVVLCFTSKASLEKKGFAKHIQLLEAKTLEQILSAIGFHVTLTSFFSDKHRQYFCMIAKKAS